MITDNLAHTTGTFYQVSRVNSINRFKKCFQPVLFTIILLLFILIMAILCLLCALKVGGSLNSFKLYRQLLDSEGVQKVSVQDCTTLDKKKRIFF